MPNVYSYVCFWQSEARWQAFTKTEEFRREIKETGNRESIDSRYVDLVPDMF
jgi:heme-degrading monooxygenase HmoA